MASLQDLPATADLILESFVAALESIGTAIPERRYVAPGAVPVWDGEQLTVLLQSIDQGQPGSGVTGTMYPSVTLFSATFAVSLVREVPALEEDAPIQMMVPSAPDIGLAGASSMADASALARAAVAVHTDYSFTGPGEGFAIGPVTPVGPQGGLAGVTCLVTVSLS